MKDSGETIDELMPERFPMYGMPHDTTLRENDFYSRYHDKAGERLQPTGDLRDRAKRIRGFMDMGSGAHMPQDKSGSDQPFFNEPPLHPELRSEQQNIEVKPDIKVAVYIDGREIHSEVRAIIDNEKFYNRSNYTGSVLS